MVKVWHTEDGSDFTCPHCGALYAVRITRYPVRESESATCDICHQTMNSWRSTDSPSYTLIRRTKPPPNSN